MRRFLFSKKKLTADPALHESYNAVIRDYLSNVYLVEVEEPDRNTLFNNIFPRDRFVSILRYFHLADNRKILPPGNPNYDPRARFVSRIVHANKLLLSVIKNGVFI